MKGGNELTKEELGQLILSSERQLYATAKTIQRIPPVFRTLHTFTFA